MYILPNSTIKLLSGVPLTANYEHTIYFTTLVQQSTFFDGFAFRQFDNYSYTRVGKNKVRVSGNATDYYDINYIKFKNVRYINQNGAAYPVNVETTPHRTNSKWFYAFVTGVEYINEVTTEITFEIDVLQTYMFDYELLPCFVEREHTISDNIFENIVEENLDMGDEYVNNWVKNFDLGNLSGVMLLKRKVTGDVPGLNLEHSRSISNVFMPLNILPLGDINTTTGLDLVDNTINSLENAAEDIITISEFPSKLIPLIWNNRVSSIASVLSSDPDKGIHGGLNPGFDQIDGYTPKNKKLFCYPYSVLLVSNNQGGTAKYHWEDFSQDIGVQPSNYTFVFRVVGTPVTMPIAACFPMDYKNIDGSAYDYGLIMKDFPQCAWEGDAFKAWWAVNKNSFVTSQVTGGIQSILGGANHAANQYVSGYGNPAMTGLTTLTNLGAQVANSLAKVADIQNMPGQTAGQVQTDCLNAGLNRYKFTFYSQTIKAEYAEIIDNYFTRFGYACKKIKTPNINARKAFTYTKTTGCTIKNNGVPADDAEKICKIFDNGITFWRTSVGVANIGDYSIDNTV